MCLNCRLVYSDQDIINGCLRNEKFYQELLYKRFAPKMFGICLRYAPDRDTASDIFQEGFVRVYRSLHQFKGKSALSSWMYTVFVSTAINYIKRKLKTHFEVSLNENLNLVEESISENEREHWLNHISSEEAMEMVQKLPEKYRLVINMYAIDRMGHADIAEKLGINEATSRSQLSRARKLLSEMLKIEMEKKVGK